MTAVSHSVPTRRSVRIAITGPGAFDPALEQALAERLDVEVVGRHAEIAVAIGQLSEHEPEVVLHGIGPANGTAAAGERVRADLRVIREHTTAPVVLLVDTMSPELLADALDAGASDVVVLPLMLDTLPFAIHKARQGRGPAEPAPEGDGMGQVVTVFSPKGGTGKTVLSTNLAAWLGRRSGKRVLLIDLDLQFGDASMMLGVTPAKTIYDLVTGPGELDSEKLAGFTTHHGSGIEILAAPVRPEEAEVVTEAKVRQIIEVARGAYDVVVLDTSPFFYGPLLATLDSTDRLLLLCGLDAPTMKNVRLGLRTLELIGFRRDRVDVVLNRVEPGDDTTRVDVEGVLDMPVRFVLPQDPSVLVAVNRGEPAALLDERSFFANAVRDIVASLVPSGAAQPARPAEGIRARLQGWRR